MLSPVRLEVTVFAQADQVVRIQCDARIPDVLRSQVDDVMHIVRRSSALPAQVAVPHQTILPDIVPHFGFIKALRKLSGHA